MPNNNEPSRTILPELLTLNEALLKVADRSFYEEADVVPVLRADDAIPGSTCNPVGYIVEDSPSGSNIAENWTWTYKDGLINWGVASEHSRLHTYSERYTAAEHIRYNMPNSVKALEDGYMVTFAYIVVYMDESDPEVDIEAGEPVGWILTSIIWE